MMAAHPMLFLCLCSSAKSVEQSQSHFEGVRPDIWVVFIIGIAPIIGTLPLNAEVVFQLEDKSRIKDEQLSVAFVALRVEIERIGVLQVFAFISFPRIDMVIVHEQRSIRGAAGRSSAS